MKNLIIFPEHFHNLEQVEPSIQPTVCVVFECLADHLAVKPTL